MRLSKPVALLVLIATLFPIAYLVFFCVTVMSVVMSAGPHGPGDAWIRVLFVLHAVCILWIWGLLAFYLLFLFKTDAVSKDQKALWAVV
jgi:hypothetical protein